MSPAARPPARPPARPAPKSKIDYKALLQKSFQSSYEKRDDSGKFGNIWKPGLEIPQWKCSEGTHIIDIIPYIGGDSEPRGLSGELVHYLDVWVHFGVGPGEDTVVCPTKTFRDRTDIPADMKRCPICEEENELKKVDGFDDEIVKSLRSKRRSIYNIIVRDNGKEEAKGLQVWDVAFFFMEKNLIDICKNPNTGDFDYFVSPDDGKQIKFTQKGAKKNVSFLGHVLLPRDYTIDQETMESAICLDESMEVLTYEEIADMFFAGYERKAEEATPVRTAARTSRQPISSSEEDVPFGSDSDTSAGEEAAPECPEGGVLGADMDRFRACENCTIFNICLEEKDRLDAEAEPAPAPAQTRKPATLTGTRKPGLRR